MRWRIFIFVVAALVIIAAVAYFLLVVKQPASQSSLPAIVKSASGPPDLSWTEEKYTDIESALPAGLYTEGGVLAAKKGQDAYGGKEYEVYFVSNRSAEGIAKLYYDFAAQNGMKNVDLTSSGDGNVLFFRASDESSAKSLMVAITKKSKGAEVDLTYSVK